MFYIAIAIFIVLVTVCSIVAFSFGRHLERETQSKISNDTIQNLNNVNKFMLAHTEKQQETWLGVLKNKDDIITSLYNENKNLKEHLDDFEGMLEDGDDSSDEDSEEPVGVLANTADMQSFAADKKSTVASVALELHETIQAAKQMLHAFGNKIEPDVYKHLAVALGDKVKDNDVN